MLDDIDRFDKHLPFFDGLLPKDGARLGAAAVCAALIEAEDWHPRASF